VLIFKFGNEDAIERGVINAYVYFSCLGRYTSWSSYAQHGRDVDTFRFV